MQHPYIAETYTTGEVYINAYTASSRKKLYTVIEMVRYTVVQCLRNWYQSKTRMRLGLPLLLYVYFYHFRDIRLFGRKSTFFPFYFLITPVSFKALARVFPRDGTKMLEWNKNLAIANRSRVSCAHNTLKTSICINITPWPWNLG